VTTQQAIRASFDRLIDPYATSDGIALPVAFKIGSGRKAALKFTGSPSRGSRPGPE
jgi:hypothetical protein